VDLGLLQNDIYNCYPILLLYFYFVYQLRAT
jgi:hypothetical protein